MSYSIKKDMEYMMKNENISLPKKDVQLVFALYSNGEFKKAVDEIKTLGEKYPNQPFLFNLIGACYKELGELAGAAKMFEIAISLSQNYAEAHFNLGAINQELGNKELAVSSYKKAIEITPNYPAAHNNLGNVYRQIGDLEASIESLEWAVAYKHDFAEAYNNLGNSLNEYGRTEDAIKSFEKAISLDSNYARAIFNLALALKDIGNKDYYHKMMEKTVDLKPNWSDAQLFLSRVKKFTSDDPRILEIESFLTNKELSLKDRINFNFTLANVYEDIKDYDKQFKYLNEANSLRKEESEYIFEKDQKLFSTIKQIFNKPPAILSGSILNASTIRPIFILGMPRSGTSLVHQIISNHKIVYGAGELTKLHKFVTPFLKRDKSVGIKDDLKYLRNNYLDALSSLNVSETIIIDKLPLNFRYIGFIFSAFPDAKIIHMNRDPMAVCWSIYKYFFPGNSYSYNQEDLAKYFCLYTDLMQFWNKLFPNKIYDCIYEDLTKNQEIETRKILKYCDLEWDENCLNFHKNKTTVKTTSSLQVKQKMYQGSSEVWKEYEAYLQPLIKGLNLNKK